jgi:hypothetical protein
MWILLSAIALIIPLMVNLWQAIADFLPNPITQHPSALIMAIALNFAKIKTALNTDSRDRTQICSTGQRDNNYTKANI